MLKLLILGDGNVGKTAIFNRFIFNEFPEQYKATIGSDYTSKQQNIDGQNITLQVWDTAGQDRFKSLGLSLYQKTDICIIVYNVTKQNTFDSIKRYKREFLSQLGLSDSDDFCFLLLGNKTDLPGKEVDETTAREYAKNNGNMLFYEVSAKTGENIQESFESIIKKAIEKAPKDKFQSPSSTEKLENRQEKTSNNNSNIFTQFFSYVFNSNKPDQIEQKVDENTNKNTQNEKTEHDQECEMIASNKSREFELLNEKFESLKNEFEIQLVDIRNEVAAKDEELRKMQIQMETMKKKYDEEIRHLKEAAQFNKSDKKDHDKNENMEDKS